MGLLFLPQDTVKICTKIPVGRLEEKRQVLEQWSFYKLLNQYFSGIISLLTHCGILRRQEGRKNEENIAGTAVSAKWRRILSGAVPIYMQPHTGKSADSGEDIAVEREKAGLTSKLLDCGAGSGL